MYIVIDTDITCFDILSFSMSMPFLGSYLNVVKYETTEHEKRNIIEFMRQSPFFRLILTLTDKSVREAHIILVYLHL